MAHCVVEYTDNLAREADIPGLLWKLAKKFNESDGIFPIGGVRVRALKLTEYVIADGAENDAFVNITVKMGAGRPDDFKKRFFGEMFDMVKDHFEGLYAKRYLALSLYVEEADEAGSFKHNNIHARFKK
jgi:5-carboxymethyl-2-hydroxymuconate isomerase